MTRPQQPSQYPTPAGQHRERPARYQQHPGQYQQRPGQYQHPPRPVRQPWQKYPKTNVLSIVSLVVSIGAVISFFVAAGVGFFSSEGSVSSFVYFHPIPLVVAIAGTGCGHIALNQIKRRGEQGHQMAFSGLVIGYIALGVNLVIPALMILGWLIAMAAG